MVRGDLLDTVSGDSCPRTRGDGPQVLMLMQKTG